MDIIAECARRLDEALIVRAQKAIAGEVNALNATEVYITVLNNKSVLFNICTIALAVSATFGLLGVFSLGFSAILCLACYAGRKIVDESFNASIPSFIKFFVRDALKPPPEICLGDIVLLYQMVKI